MFIPLRDEARRTRFPVVTFVLAAANVTAFTVQQLLPSKAATSLIHSAGAVPWDIAPLCDLSALTIFSSMFLHSDLEHLCGNIWFLWIFGDDVEEAMGRARYALFYVAAGFASILAQALMTPSSRVPIVGASGAIAAVLGAYFTIYPRVHVEVLLFVLSLCDIVVVPAFALLGVWFLWQLALGTGDRSLAIWAHTSGFLLGVAACKLLVRREKKLWILPSARESSSLPL